MPERFQLSRRPGWKLSPNTVSVARPGRWGNPFIVRARTDWVTTLWYVIGPPYVTTLDDETAIIARCDSRADALLTAVRLYGLHVLPDLDVSELVGKNLACWCDPESNWCHGDVLLEFARR